MRYTAGVIPHVAPPVYPDPPRQGRLAATITLNTPELADQGAKAWDAPGSVVRRCRVGLLGVPDDTGVIMNHGRPGALQGPHAFRQALVRFGAAAAMAEHGRAHAAYPRVFDAGDVIPGKTLEQTHQRVSEAVTTLLGLGLLPVVVGGGHDLTFPLVRAVSQREGGPVRGVYFDAHLDVRPEPGSGMSFRRLLEDGFSKDITCVGADPFSNTQEHADWFRSHGGRIVCRDGLHEFAAPGPERAIDVERWLNRGRKVDGSGAFVGQAGQPHFVSLDMDVLDMSFAPGVSAMNPCGLSPELVGAWVEGAGRGAMTGLVKSFDIMELSPAHDEHGRTARLAAYMFVRFLRGMSNTAPGGSSAAGAGA